MKKTVRKIISLLLVFLFFISFLTAFSLFPTKTYATPSYEGGVAGTKFSYSGGEIRDKTHDELFVRTVLDPHIKENLGGINWQGMNTSDQYNNSQATVFQRDNLVFLHNSEKYAIVVSKSNPSQGQMQYYDNDIKRWWYLGDEKGFIEDIGNVDEAPIPFEKGRIVGKVLWDDPDNWLEQGGFKIEESGGTSDVRISLFYAGTPYDEAYKIDSGSVVGSVPDGTRYNAMTWNLKNPISGSGVQDAGGLYPGKYRLQYFWSNVGTSCETGKTTGWSWALTFKECKLSIRGTVSFELDKEGYVHINSKDEEELDSPANKDKNPNAKKIQDIQSTDEGINILLKVTLTNPLTEALASAINWLVGTINTAIKYFSGWVNSALLKANEIDDMKEAWYDVRTVAITLLLLGLIIIAFANVLNIDIAQYGAQRMVPRFVMNIVLTFFSFLIVKLLLEVSSILTTEFRSLLSTGEDPISYTPSIKIDNLDSSVIVDMLGTIIVLAIICIGLIVALIYLFLVLIARIVVIKFLVVMGPVALILGIMPFTESQLKQWWSELFKWIFMGPAIMGLLLVGAIITNNAPSELDPSKFSDGEFLDAFDGIFYVLTAAAAYFMAAAIPLQMGGKIMAAWDKKVRGAGKFAGGKSWDATKFGARRTANLTGLPEAWKQMREDRQLKYDAKNKKRGANVRAGIGSAGWPGRTLAGFKDKSEVDASKKQIYMAEVAAQLEKQKNLSYDEQMANLASNRPEAVRHAALKALAASKRGLAENKEGDSDWSAEDKAKWTMQQNAINEFIDRDTALSGDMYKDHLETLASGDSKKHRKNSISAIKGKSNTELSGKMVAALRRTLEENEAAGDGASADLKAAAKEAAETLQNYAPENISKMGAGTIAELQNSTKYLRADSKQYLSKQSAGKGSSSQGPTQAPRGPGSAPGF